MKLSYIIFCFILLTPAQSFAFLCPTNFNQIENGDTIERVKEQCGTADKEDTKEIPKEGPQEWSYFLTQTVAMDAMHKTQGTLKTQISFDGNGRAINISVNGIGVGATDICGTKIQLGDGRDKVKSACGDPSFINRQSTAKPESTTVTEMTYNTTPPTTLIFENGRLKERK